jgi:SAM-dependent methyltransferase
VYLSRAPDYSVLRRDLAWEKTHKQETIRRKRKLIYRLDYATRFRMKLGKWLDQRQVLRAVGKGGNVLDVGCGAACRIADGLVPFGIEISEALAKTVEPVYRRRGGYVVNAPAIDGLDRFEDEFFDCVIMRSYLEHEMHPRPVLEKVFWRLRKGGTVFVKVPDFGCLGRHVMGPNWCGFRFPDHLNYFTGASLRGLAEAVGFRFKRKNLIPMLNDNLYAVLTRFGFLLCVS